MKIMLIAGGWSSERDISLNGAREIRNALERAGHIIRIVDPLTDMNQIIYAKDKFDFAFINMHGSPGEDGLIQAILETINLPFNGSGSAASAIALNKYCAKKFFAKAGLNVLPDFLLTKNNIGDKPNFITFPAIFKPNKGGSSIYLHKFINLDEFLDKAKHVINEQNEEFILEKMIYGMEISCPVIGNSGSNVVALPLILIRPKKTELFDFYAKYNADGADEICPAPIPDALAKKISSMAITAHECLGLDGYSRSDFIVPESGEPVILEINTLPGMTPFSLFPKSAKVFGLDFEALLLKIINLGLNHFNIKSKHE